MRLFVDTGAWYEANLERTAAADAARALFSEHADGLVTSVPVVTELWTLAAAQRGADRATAICLDVSAHADVLTVEPDDHRRALAVLRTWGDQPFSYADATSFVLMARERIDAVASFDDHFRVYRYGRRRAHAFHVLP